MEDFKEAMLGFMRIQQNQNETVGGTTTFGPMFELLALKKGKEQSNTNSFSIINKIGEFKYSPEEKVTSAAYFRRYEEIFQKDCATRSDEKKIRLLLGKFGSSTHEKYASYILLRKPGEGKCHSRKLS